MDTHKKFFGKSILVSFMMIFILIGLTTPAQSQDKYPIRAIDIIAPVTPGAGVDLTARLVANYCNKKWLVPVNVINKPGGNNIPGCLEVYNAASDGYTVLLDSLTSTTGISILQNLPFKIMDRTFFGRFAITPLLLIVPANSPFKTLREVAEAAKKDPTSFTWGSIGGTSPPDIVQRQYFKAMGIDAKLTKPVMTQGGSQLVVLVAGGNVKLGGGTTTGVLPAYKSGTVRPLGITGKARNPDYPGVPTFTELGYPEINVVQWYGISGPAKVPSSIVDLWDKAFQEMVKDHDITSKMISIGAIPSYVNAAANKEAILKDTEVLQQLLR